VGHTIGKAEPFRKAGGRAAGRPLRPQAKLDEPERHSPLHLAQNPRGTRGRLQLVVR
jgi:hypothetical protein